MRKEDEGVESIWYTFVKLKRMIDIKAADLGELDF